MNPLAWLTGNRSAVPQGGPQPVREAQQPGRPQAPYRREGRGLLGWLADSVGGWLGPRLSVGTPADVEVRTEHVRGGPAQVAFPQFPPYLNEVTGETAGIRAQYRLMLADPYVKQSLMSQVLAVAALDLKVLPATKKDPRDKETRDFAFWNLSERCRGGLAELAWSILSGGLVDGYSISEKVWALEHKGDHAGRYVLDALKPKDTDHDAILVTDEFRNVIAVRALRYNAGEDYSPSNFTIWRNTPFYSSATGMSALRCAYRAWWILSVAIKLRALMLEKRALPMLVGHYRLSSSKASVEAALNLAKSQNWLSVPEDVRVEALDIALGADDVFKSACADLREEIVYAIQGATLQALVGQEGSQRGDTEVHRDTTQLLTWWLSKALEPLLNELVRDLIDLNYVVDRYPRCTLSAVDSTQLKAELDIDQGLHQMGYPLSLEELSEKYGRTLPTSKEDTLAGQQAPGQGGSPGAPPGGGGPSPFDDGGGTPPTKPTEPTASEFDAPPAPAAGTAPGGPSVQDVLTPPPKRTFLAERDDVQAEKLLKGSISQGGQSLRDVTKGVVKRALTSGEAPAFTGEERQQVADALASTLATGELLGRARIRRRAEQLQERATRHAERVRRFSEEPTDLSRFGEEITPLPPREALDYFRSLVGTPGVKDPGRWADDQHRAAFTLARQTEAEVLQRVQDAIADALESGKVGSGPKAVQRVLDAAGVGSDPSYSEMVFRTNMRDAYNTGSTRELQDPDVQETFPAWQYSNPDDSRSRPRHAALNGRLFPSSVSFAEVRGTDIGDLANCVLPGNYVGGRIVGALKARYAGEAVEIRTWAGHRLTVTVHHPVLTEHGFVAAGQIEQGDHLACCGGDVERLRAGDDVEDAPALIEQVFDTLQTRSAVRVKQRSVVDLYGDGKFLQSDIEVVRADRLLRFRPDAEHPQGVAQIGFACSDVEHSGSVGDGPGRLYRVAVALTAPGGVGSSDLPSPLAGVGHPGPLEGFGFALSTDVNTLVQQAATDHGSGDTEPAREGVFGFAGFVQVGDFVRGQVDAPEHRGFGPGADLDVLLPEPRGQGIPLHADLFGKLVERFSGTVSLDQVVEVRRFHYEGPVYDLETTVGYFTANSNRESRSAGIVIKNCRCDQIPVDKWELAERLEEGAKLERFSEDDGFAAYAAGSGFTGERKDSLGRRTCWQSGKRVPCGQKPQPKAQPKPRPAPAATVPSVPAAPLKKLGKPSGSKTLQDYVANGKGTGKELLGLQYGKDQDAFLAGVLHETGRDGLPKVVSKAEMDALVAKGSPELFRATARPEQADQFRGGKLYVGAGRFGNGVYAFPGADNAKLAADLYGGGGKGATVRMTLAPGAKVADFATLRDQRDKTLARIKGAMAKEKDPARQAKLQRLYNVNVDMGRFAALHDYDAIHAREGGEFIVLNRRALIVQKENHGQETAKLAPAKKPDAGKAAQAASPPSPQERQAFGKAADVNPQLPSSAALGVAKLTPLGPQERGISPAFTTEIGGKKYFVKNVRGNLTGPATKKVLDRGKVEARAEIGGEIAARLMGVQAPAVRPVMLGGAEHVVTDWAAGKVLADHKDARGTVTAMDPDKSHAVLLLDVLTGNRDRHEGNLLVSPTGDPVAIDHGVAFQRPFNRDNLDEHAIATWMDEKAPLSRKALAQAVAAGPRLEQHLRGLGMGKEADQVVANYKVISKVAAVPNATLADLYQSLPKGR